MTSWASELDNLGLDIPVDLRDTANKEDRPYGGYRHDSPEAKQRIKEQRQALVRWLKGVGACLLRDGVNLTKIPVPVELFEPRSFLQRLSDSWGYMGLLRAAAECRDPAERMKLVVAFAVSGLYRQVSFEKPFNPLLGETFQAHIGEGVTLLAEQISHHPPISAWQVYDAAAKFRFYGHAHMSATVRGNSVKATQEGFTRVWFASDGAEVSWTEPGTTVKGVILGDRVVKHGGVMHFTDKQNGLTCEVEVDVHRRKGILVVGKLLHRGKHKQHDQIKGVLKHGHTVLDTCVGSWLTHVEWEKGVRETSVPPALLRPAASSPARQGAKPQASAAPSGLVRCHSIGSFSSSTSDAGEEEEARGANDAAGADQQAGTSCGAAALGASGSSISSTSGGASSDTASDDVQRQEQGAGRSQAGAGEGGGAEAANGGRDEGGHRVGSGIGVVHRLWEARTSQVVPVTPLAANDPSLLPSDSRFRADLASLLAGDVQAAQRAKTELEERQRADRKLRAAGGGCGH